MSEGEEEEEEREKRLVERKRKKNLFAAVSVNKYIRMATETDVDSAKRKC